MHQHMLEGLWASGLSSAIDTIAAQHCCSERTAEPIRISMYRLMPDYIDTAELIFHSVDNVLVVPLPISGTSAMISGISFISPRMK